MTISSLVQNIWFYRVDLSSVHTKQRTYHVYSFCVMLYFYPSKAWYFEISIFDYFLPSEGYTFQVNKDYLNYLGKKLSLNYDYDTVCMEHPSSILHLPP